MGPDSSLPCSQNHTTCPYPDPAESISHHHPSFFKSLHTYNKPNSWARWKTKQASCQSDLTLTRQLCPSGHLNGVSRPWNMLLTERCSSRTLGDGGSRFLWNVSTYPQATHHIPENGHIQGLKESKFILIFSFHLCLPLESSFFHLDFLIELYALLGQPWRQKQATNWHLSTLLHSIITQKMAITAFHPMNTACSVIPYFSFHHPSYI